MWICIRNSSEFIRMFFSREAEHLNSICINSIRVSDHSIRSISALFFAHNAEKQATLINDLMRAESIQYYKNRLGTAVAKTRVAYQQHKQLIDSL